MAKGRVVFSGLQFQGLGVALAWFLNEPTSKPDVLPVGGLFLVDRLIPYPGGRRLTT